MKYAYKPSSSNYVRVCGQGLRISRKHSIAICKKLTGCSLAKGKLLLENLINGKRTIDGKHYFTKASNAILNLLNSAEKNAEFKGLDTDRLIIHAWAGKGYTFLRPRRAKLRGQQRRITHIQITLEQK
jgi:large subunit ribosomal protein L22